MKIQTRKRETKRKLENNTRPCLGRTLVYHTTFACTVHSVHLRGGCFHASKSVENTFVYTPVTVHANNQDTAQTITLHANNENTKEAITVYANNENIKQTITVAYMLTMRILHKHTTC